ncbi:MAG: GNAT family N-acetyltransferase [Candidatus Eremiobacteraeota bacterium]|nr:GNAT family N-acetyltransferase [Candidatus Eremiobacteraeota bacterium]
MARDKAALELPADQRYIPAATSFVGQFAQELGLSEKQAKKLQCATRTSLSNLMVRRGVDRLTLFVESCPHELRLRFVDTGIPTDEPFTSLHPEGLHVYLTEHELDEVRFSYLGRQGNETLLVRSFQEPPPARTPLSQPKVDIAADAEYEVRLMRPEEALEVARCIYTAYGYSYPVDAVYLPQRLQALCESGEMLTAVAVCDGQIFGTMSLEPGFGATVRDMGLAATYPECRGQGAAKRLFSFLVEEAARTGLEGLTGWGVTAHVYSQKLAGDEMRPCALLVGNAPNTFQIKGMEQTQRGSVIGYYRELQPGQRAPVSVPARHRDMVETLFDRLGWHTAAPTGAFDRQDHSELIVRGNQERAGAILSLKTAGKDARRVLTDAHDRLTQTGTVEFMVILDLADPGTADLAEFLEAEQHYFFCGIMPRTSCGNALLMQCLHTEPLDYDQIQLLSEEAKDLRAYIQKGDPSQ